MYGTDKSDVSESDEECPEEKVDENISCKTAESNCDTKNCQKKVEGYPESELTQDSKIFDGSHDNKALSNKRSCGLLGRIEHTAEHEMTIEKESVHEILPLDSKIAAHRFFLSPQANSRNDPWIDDKRFIQSLKKSPGFFQITSDDFDLVFPTNQNAN